MKYLIVSFMVFIFTVPLALANGGGSPSVEMLYEQSRTEKQMVRLIDTSREKGTQKLCVINLAQNTVDVKKFPC